MLPDAVTCPFTLKVTYDTHAAALQARARHRHGRGESLNAYRCEFCDLWHLGTNFFHGRQAHVRRVKSNRPRG